MKACHAGYHSVGATYMGAGTLGWSETFFPKSSLYCSPVEGRASISMTAALIAEDVEVGGEGEGTGAL